MALEKQKRRQPWSRHQDCHGLCLETASRKHCVGVWGMWASWECFWSSARCGWKFNAKSPECSASDLPLRMLRLKFLHVTLYFAGMELIQMSAVCCMLQDAGFPSMQVILSQRDSLCVLALDKGPTSSCLALSPSLSYSHSHVWIIEEEGAGDGESGDPAGLLCGISIRPENLCFSFCRITVPFCCLFRGPFSNKLMSVHIRVHKVFFQCGLQHPPACCVCQKQQWPPWLNKMKKRYAVASNRCLIGFVSCSTAPTAAWQQILPWISAEIFRTLIFLTVLSLRRRLQQIWCSSLCICSDRGCAVCTVYWRSQWEFQKQRRTEIETAKQCGLLTHHPRRAYPCLPVCVHAYVCLCARQLPHYWRGRAQQSLRRDESMIEEVKTLADL